MTKAQVITFPFALLLLDYWPLNRIAVGEEGAGEHGKFAVTVGHVIGEKVPWFVLSAASALITMRAEAGATQFTLPFWAHLANAALSYAKYLGKAFWPFNLAVIYPHPQFTISIAAAISSAVVIIAISILAVIFHRRRPFFVGWFWFVGTMVPMIGLVQIGVHGMADRYAYIPFLGLFVVICWGVAECVERWRIPAAVFAPGIALVALMLGVALHRQIGFWGDNVTLWRHTLEITENNYMAEDNLATALLAQGNVEEAVAHLRRAKFIRPDDAGSTLNLATYEQMRGNFQAAIDGYTKIPLFTKEPYLLAMARVNSGYAHYSLKQFNEAKLDFEAALRWQPENSVAYRGLGLASQKTGDIGHAIQDYERAVELQPTPSGYLLLAQALDIDRQPEAARAAESQAARMTPDLRDDLAIVKRFLAN
jgi:tetratricopeptide (TPR) repeat protein